MRQYSEVEQTGAGAQRYPGNCQIAVIIPCYNEEITIESVVLDFRAELPSAAIYVFDNNSSDRTVEIAEKIGAIVRHEQRQGKGYVVQTMFRTVDADIYILVDGDATYAASGVHDLIAPIIRGEADMVVGSRLQAKSASEFRVLNRLGNRMFLWVLNSTFKSRITDVLSGYRAFSRQFAKSIPLFGGGFEIETEMTIKALERGYRVVEVTSKLSARPEGSSSKIRIVQDGILILNTILTLFRDYKPLTFFGIAGLLLMAAGLVPGLVVISEFLRTGLVSRLPSAVLAAGLELAGMLSISVGLVLHTLARHSQELDLQLRNLTAEIHNHIDKVSYGRN